MPTASRNANPAMGSTSRPWKNRSGSMKSSYKITFAATAVFCLVLLVYYAWPGSRTSTSLSSAGGAPETTPAAQEESGRSGSAEGGGESDRANADPEGQGQAAEGSEAERLLGDYRRRFASSGNGQSNAGSSGEAMPRSGDPSTREAAPTITLGRTGARFSESSSGDSPGRDAADRGAPETGSGEASEPPTPAGLGERPIREGPDRAAGTDSSASSTSSVSSASPQSAEQDRADAPSRPERERTSGSTTGTYTIQPGDTFSSIAVAEFGSDRYWVDIAQANPLVDPARLKVGQEIRLPSVYELREADEAVAAPSETVEYTIRSGDSLSSIAGQFYGDPGAWKRIWQTNRDQLGTDPDALKPGMIIRIPPAPQGAN